MGWLKDTAGKVGSWAWDNVVPNFKRGGKVIRVVVVKPRRKVQKAKKRK